MTLKEVCRCIGVIVVGSFVVLGIVTHKNHTLAAFATELKKYIGPEYQDTWSQRTED